MCRKLLLSGICLLSFGFTGCLQPSSLPKSNRDAAAKFLPENDFPEVCNGIKVAGAASYDETPGTTSPIIIFYRHSTIQSYQRDFLAVPDDWRTESYDNSKTQLVACITLLERKEAKVCRYEGKYKLKFNADKYQINVYETQSGKLLGEKAFELSTAKECPPITFFTGVESTENPDYKPAVTDYLKPFVKH